jgi:hypothetical protein
VSAGRGQSSRDEGEASSRGSIPLPRMRPRADRNGHRGFSRCSSGLLAAVLRSSGDGPPVFSRGEADGTRVNIRCSREKNSAWSSPSCVLLDILACSSRGAPTCTYRRKYVLLAMTFRWHCDPLSFFSLGSSSLTANRVDLGAQDLSESSRTQRFVALRKKDLFLSRKHRARPG